MRQSGKNQYTQLFSRGSPLRLGTRRERGRGGANPGGAGRGSAHGGDGEGFPVALSGFATAAGNAYFVRAWVPKDRHPVGAVEGCGPQVRELGEHILSMKSYKMWPFVFGFFDLA